MGALMQPAFILRTPRGGDRLTRALLGRSASLTVTDAKDRDGDTIEIVLDDRDGKIVIPDGGTELIDLYIGYVETDLLWFGRYTIDEIGASAPPCTITLSGKSADMQSTLKTPKHGFTANTTVGDWVRDIATKNGLDADIAADLAQLALPQLNWRSESDLHILNRVADRLGAMVKFDKGVLRFKWPVGKRLLAGATDIDVTLIYGNQITRYDWRAQSRTQYKGVRSYYYDKHKAQRVPVTIGDVTDADPVLEVRHDSDDADSAYQAASARKDKLDKGTASLTLTMTGNPKLRADQIILVEQLRAGIDGAWAIKSAQHRFDGSGGYVTTLECEPPAGSKSDRAKATKSAKEYNDETERREKEIKDGLQQ